MAARSNYRKYKGTSLTNIKSKLCANPELSEAFVNDVIRITGYDIDSEGYLVDPESDPFEPDYILVKNKALRHTNSGVVHSTDLIFDPYNNCLIMEELWKKYLEENHPNVASAQIYANSQSQIPRINTYGYITILFDDGSKIQTANHWKDTTKYLEAFMRMESMTDFMISEVMKPYDDYENYVFKNNLGLEPGSEGKIQ